MAEIELEYLVYFCPFNECEPCSWCYDINDGCERYTRIKSDRLGDDVCVNIRCSDRYVGANTKSYEIQLPENGFQEYASVRIGRKWYYDVTKVTLNGKVVFDCG